MCTKSNQNWWTLAKMLATQARGFTVTWFVGMFENLTKCASLINVCLIWKFSRGGWMTAFLPGNNSAPWKRCAKIEPKSKHGRKESWIEPNGHNHDKSRIPFIITPLFADDPVLLAFNAIETIKWNLPISIVPVICIISKFSEMTGAIGMILMIIWDMETRLYCIRTDYRLLITITS